MLYTAWSTKFEGALALCLYLTHEMMPLGFARRASERQIFQRLRVASERVSINLDERMCHE